MQHKAVPCGAKVLSLIWAVMRSEESQTCCAQASELYLAVSLFLAHQLLSFWWNVLWPNSGSWTGLSALIWKTRCIIFIMFELQQIIFPFQVFTIVLNRAESMFRRMFLNLFVNQFLHPWMTLLETWHPEDSWFPELLVHCFASQVRLFSFFNI